MLNALHSTAAKKGAADSKAKSGSHGQKTASAGTSDTKKASSADRKENAAPTGVEGSLVGTAPTRALPVKQKGDSGGTGQNFSGYNNSAETPLVAADQESGAAQKKLSPLSVAVPSAKDEKSFVLSKLGRDVSAFLKTVDDKSESGGQTQQTEVSDTGRVGVEPGNAGKEANARTVEKDLLQLLSTSGDGKIDGKILQELKAIVTNGNQGEVLSNREVSRKLQNDSALSASGKPAAESKAASRLSTISESGGMRVAKEDLSGVIAADSKSGAANLSKKYTAASSVETGVKSVDVRSAIVEQGSKTGVPQATTGNQQATAGQGKANPDQGVPNRPVQVLPTHPNTGGQGSLDSGKGQQDASGFGSTRMYAANANNGNPGVSFVQTLSSAPKILTNTTPSINLYRLAQGIVKHVSMMTQEGKKIVNMKLEPESLGSVSLQVVSDGGKISAQFNVGSSDARMLLESSMPQLRQMLETNGVTLAHLSVNLSGGESQPRDARNGYRPRKQNWKYFSGPTENVAQVGSPEMSRSFGYNTMEMQV